MSESHDSYYFLTACDLSDTLQQPPVEQMDETDQVTAAQLTWAFSSGIYVQAADLNGDGYDELITHTDQRVYRFDWNGTSFARSTLFTVPVGYAFQSGYGAIADANGDGDLEYLISYSSLNTPSTNGRLVEINLDGTVNWEYGDDELNTYPITGTQPGVCDLSGYPSSPETPVGRLSPITTTRGDSRMYNSATGELRSDAWPNLQLYYPNDQRNVSSPALAYVTGTVTQPQFIKVDMGYPSVGTDEIRVYDPITGNEVYSADLNVPSLYTADPYSAVTSTPVYGDLDGNGQGSILTSFRTGANTLRIFRTDPGSAFHQGLAEWSQIEGGPEHKGLYAQPVSGAQPQTDMVWSGRIVIQDVYYIVDGQTLTIKPGTVVELTPDAELFVWGGTLIAEGTDADSIYFQKISANAGRWGDLYFANNSTVHLDHCVITGGINCVQYPAEVTIRNCRIDNLVTGI